MAKIYNIDNKLIYEKKGATYKDTIIAAIESGCKLDYAYLSGLNLIGVNLNGASLVGANLSACRIQTCSFVGSDLRHVDLSGAKANGAYFNKADLSGAVLVEADLNNAYLNRADLTKSNLSKANLWGASFCCSITTGANLSGSNIYNANFYGADLDTVDLTGAVVDFSDGDSKYDIQKYVEKLNAKHTVPARCGWVIEAKGPGRPSKWNGKWENLFVCAKRTSEGPSSTKGLKNSESRIGYGGFSDRPKDTYRVLADRAQRYGSFNGHAAISQALQKVVYKGFAKREDGKTAQDMTDAQREALFMILHKVARIVNGDFNYDDSWRDIAGYATLVTNLLDKEKTK